LLFYFIRSDINARVETLERRFSDFENATNIKEKRNAGETESKVTDTNKTMKKKNLEIQSMMRKTLKEEKTERLKFFNSVKNQIEKVDERVSQFMNTTDASLNEQIRKSESGLKEIRNEVSDIRESIDKEVSSVDKGIVDDVIAMVKKSTTDLTKFQGQLKEHLKTSDSRFGTVAQISK
jgi:flagellar biosynthesis GTPase FlhF